MFTFDFRAWSTLPGCKIFLLQILMCTRWTHYHYTFLLRRKDNKLFWLNWTFSLSRPNNTYCQNGFWKSLLFIEVQFPPFGIVKKQVKMIKQRGKLLGKRITVCRCFNMERNFDDRKKRNCIIRNIEKSFWKANIEKQTQVPDRCRKATFDILSSALSPIKRFRESIVKLVCCLFCTIIVLAILPSNQGWKKRKDQIEGLLWGKVMYDIHIQCTMVQVAWRHFFPWLQDLPPEVGFLF